MDIGLIVVIVVLVGIVVALVLYNLSTYKKIKGLSNTHEKIANLRVLQDFMDTIGQNTSAENKIKIINEKKIFKRKNDDDSKFNLEYLEDRLSENKISKIQSLSDLTKIKIIIHSITKEMGV